MFVQNDERLALNREGNSLDRLRRYVLVIEHSANRLFECLPVGFDVSLQEFRPFTDPVLFVGDRARDAEPVVLIDHRRFQGR
jgi:hypothetical protein